MTRHVYIHVPFCARRCSYCDFAIAVRKTVPVDEYLAALAAELQTRFGGEGPATVDTIYFGGGTPSRMGGEGIARALEIVSRQFQPAGDAEITIEVNPDDVTSANTDAWFSAGVNRVSLGAQSFDDAALEWMHRTHSASATEMAIDTLRAGGITNLSLDLIFALPAALRRNLRRDLNAILRLAPEHVSLYGLTIERETPLGKWVAAGRTTELAEEGYEGDYLLAHQILTSSGLEHYEVSSYGRPGLHARHNTAYWTGASYVGLGPSAHGFDGATRRWNVRQYAAWLLEAQTGRDPLEGVEQLSAANREAERIYLGLRTTDGLRVRPSELPIVAAWVDAGFAEFTGSRRLRCTALGWLRLDSLAGRLLQASNDPNP